MTIKPNARKATFNCVMQDTLAAYLIDLKFSCTLSDFREGHSHYETTLAHSPNRQSHSLELNAAHEGRHFQVPLGLFGPVHKERARLLGRGTEAVAEVAGVIAR